MSPYVGSKSGYHDGFSDGRWGVKPYVEQMSSNASACESVDFARHSALSIEQGRTRMKIMRLSSLALLAICVAGVSYAQDAANRDSHKPKASRAKSSKPQSELLAAPVAGGAEDRLMVNMNMKPDTPDSLDNANANTNTCAYMRTYRVKRQ